MSKVKVSGSNHYELLYIISNNFSEDELAPINEKVKKIITDNGGQITHTEDWGKKRLSYQIKTFFYGYYELVEFDGPRENLSKIERALRMSSDVLRHQIVAKKIKSAEEIAKEKKIAEKIATKIAQEEAKTEQKEKEKDEKKIDLKDLDDKLDKILETDNLL